MIEIILFIVLISISVLLKKNLFERNPDSTKKSQNPQIVQQTYESKIFGVGGSFLVLALGIGIIGIILLAGYWLIFPSPDTVYTPTDLQKMCSGDCRINGDAITLSNYATLRIPNNDFGEISIYLTEKLSKGSVMDVSIGPHKAHIWVGKCQYSLNPTCYRGEWWYTATSPELGETHSSRDELQYAEASLLPLRITKSYPDLTAITSTTNLQANIGDKVLVTALRNNVQTPQPVKGTLTIKCSNCKIKEVRIYYNLIAKLQDKLIG